jgi:hypothetical protein
MNQFVEFLGYVFCFWILWKIFDKLLHLVYKKPKIKDVGCIACEQKDKRIGQLQSIIKGLEEKFSVVSNVKASVGNIGKKLEIIEKRTEPDTLEILNYLNKAEEMDLKSLLGSKSRRISTIISKRPYSSIYDAEAKLGIKTMAIVLEKMRTK